jgi:hypothetical protein
VQTKIHPFKFASLTANALGLSFDLLDFAVGALLCTLKACFVTLVISHKVNRPEGTAEAGRQKEHEKREADEGHLSLLAPSLLPVGINIEHSKQIHPPESPDTWIPCNVQCPEADEQRNNGSNGKTDGHTLSNFARKYAIDVVWDETAVLNHQFLIH